MRLNDNRLQYAHRITLIITVSIQVFTCESQSDKFGSGFHIFHQQVSWYKISIVGIEGDTWLPTRFRFFGRTFGNIEKCINISPLH